MREERIGEKLRKIVVRYERGRVEPLYFQWGTRDFHVRVLNSHWIDRMTRPVRYFFSVTADSGEVFLLSYREGETVWYLDSLIVNGR